MPVPGHPGVFVGYQKLLLLEEKGTTLDAEEVDGRLVEVDVAAALNGVTERENREDEERKARTQKEEGNRHKEEDLQSSM